MHVLGTGVPRRLGVARSASSPKAAQTLGCSLTPGLRISFGRVTCMARAASVPGLWTLGFLLLCGACVWVLVVLGLGFWLRPATPGWGDGVCVCLRARSACTPPLLAGLCIVPVCAWARVSAAPRHSWLGCLCLSVLVCPLHFYPATPRWGVRWGCVCLGSGFGCAPPLLAGVCGVGVCAWARVFGCAPPLLAGVFGCVRVCVRAPFVPRHSWLECAVGVSVLGLGSRLHPATPGWGLGLFACLFVCSACTPPLLAGVCVCVCVWAGVLAAPRHSWQGCWGVRVFVRAPLVPHHSWPGCVVWVCVLGLGFRLRPATPGWGVGLCLLVCALGLYPATPGRVMRCGCVCLGSCFGCTPPLLAGVLGCACLCVPPLVPRHSWLECVVWVCVLGLGFRLHPATPGWGVRSWCVCVWARVSSAPRHFWLGCWGVCVCARAPLVPRHSWLGCVVWVCVLGPGFPVHPATPGWGAGVCVYVCALGL